MKTNTANKLAVGILALAVLVSFADSSGAVVRDGIAAVAIRGQVQNVEPYVYADARGLAPASGVGIVRVTPLTVKVARPGTRETHVKLWCVGHFASQSCQELRPGQTVQTEAEIVSIRYVTQEGVEVRESMAIVVPADRSRRR